MPQNLHELKIRIRDANVQYLECDYRCDVCGITQVALIEIR
jgi:hypothetical protein